MNPNSDFSDDKEKIVEIVEEIAISNTKKEVLNLSPLVKGFAGSLSGLFVTSLLHPLDLVKTRIQIQHRNASRFKEKALKQPSELIFKNRISSIYYYRNTFNAFTTIIKSEGIRTLYQGLIPSLVGNGVSWGLFLFSYDLSKKVIAKINNGDSTKLRAHENFIAGLSAGIFTALCTNPIWLVKTRLQLQVRFEPNSYANIRDCIRTIYREEGYHGFYRGLTPALINSSHGAIQLMLYEELKSFFSRNKPFLSSSEIFITALGSKIVATVATYPYQVMKSRLQERNSTYKGFMDVIKKTWKIDGSIGFYRGFMPHLYRVAPQSALTFFVYEKILYFILSIQ